MDSRDHDSPQLPYTYEYIEGAIYIFERIIIIIIIKKKYSIKKEN